MMSRKSYVILFPLTIVNPIILVVIIVAVIVIIASVASSFTDSEKIISDYR